MESEMATQSVMLEITTLENYLSTKNDTTVLAEPLRFPNDKNWIFMLSGTGLMVLSVAGVASNTLNIRIFRKIGQASSANISFTALSVADLICACFYLVFALILQDMSGLIDLGVNMYGLLKIIDVTIYYVVALRSLVITLISIEKCCCIVSSVHKGTKQSVSRKATVCLVTGAAIVYVALVVSTLAGLSFTVNHSPTSGRPRILLEYSNYVLALAFWGASVPVRICLVLVLFKTIFLAISLGQKSKQLQSLPEQRNETIAMKKKLILSVVAISVIYLACLFPIVATSWILTIGDTQNPLKAHAMLVGSFTMNLQALSGVLNILIYYKMNSQFKQELRNLRCNACSEIRALQDQN